MKKNPLITRSQIATIMVYGVVQTAIWLIAGFLFIGVLLALCAPP